MKRFAAAAAIFLILSALGFGQDPPSASSPAPRFSLKIGGGAGYATLGDLAKGIDGQMAYLDAEYGNIQGGYKSPVWGIASGGELIFHLSSRLAIGLGAGYVQHLKESQVSYVISFIEAKETIKPSVSVIPVTMNVHFYLPLGRRLKIDLFAGAGYYLATLKYDYRLDLSLMEFTGYDLSTFKGRRGSVGFQGGIGIELPLGRRLAVCLDVVGRYASISDFSGDWTQKGSGDFWDYDDSGSGQSAWYYVWTYGGNKYSQVVFQEEQPFGSLVSEVRKAKVDLTGIAALLSLKIGLF